MDGRESRYIKEVWDWYRDEDTGDLRRNKLNEIVENWTCLNAQKWEKLDKLEKREKLGKLDKWRIREEVHIVMNDEFVKNSVMNAKIDP